MHCIFHVFDIFVLNLYFAEKIENMLREVLRVCGSDQLAIHCHDTNGRAVENIAKSLEA